MKIICYGDSNTYGFDPRIGTPGRLPKEDRWTGILDGMSELTVVNEGMNGRMIPDGAGAFRNLGSIIRRNMDADVLVIMLGTNDMFMMRGASAKKLSERMRVMFEGVAELREFRDCPGKRIFLVCPPPPSKSVRFYRMVGISVSQTSAEIERIVSELPGAYAAVAESEGIGFIDASRWDIGLLYDGLHFSEAGHREFARRMYEIIE